MINGKISQIKNKNGEVSFPVTTSKAVYMQDGTTTVEKKFEEVNSSLETKANYPVLSWEKINNVSTVEDVTLPYGHVKRYGAKGDGVTDDSQYFQKCFDVCSCIGQKIYIKDGKFLINQSIILKKAYDGSVFNEYNLIGEVLTINRHDQDTVIDSRKGVILSNCDLFVAVSDFEEYRFSMKGVQIKFLTENQNVVLKNVAIVNSFIENNYIIYASAILQGYMKYLCKIRNNHFHFIGCLMKASNAYVSVDSYIENNYILGYRNANPTMILAQLDQTVFITNNFIDQWKFIFSSLDNKDGMIKIGNFSNNDVNICFRVVETNIQIDFGVIHSNHFINCNYTRGSQLFGNATDDMINGKWGGIIFDDRTTRVGVANINTLIITNNILYNTDCLLHFETSSTSSKKILIQLLESNNVNANIYFEQNADYNAFNRIKLESLNYSNYSSLPAFYKSSNNSFSFCKNCIIWVNDDLYISKVISNNPAWKKINLT